MKILLTSILCLLLVACHLGDPRAPNIRANVTTVNDKVCVLIPATEDEIMQVLIINELGDEDNKIEKTFEINDANTVKLTPNKCVPDFEFKYKIGRAYTFYVGSSQLEKVKNNETPNGRNFGITFTLWESAGKLQATDIN